MNYTNRYLVHIANQCIGELEELGYKDVPLDEIRWNGRLKSALGRHIFKHRFGEVISHTIEISKMLKTEQIVRETIMHELIHALCPYDGHGRLWKSIVKQVNDAYGYNITTTKELTEEIVNMSELYGTLTCLKCSKKYKVKKSAKAYKTPMNYRCKCGGNLLK